MSLAGAANRSDAMRGLAALTALLIASIGPPPPEPLVPGAPQIVLTGTDCAGARRRADVIAHALGFAHAGLSCKTRPIATLSRPATPRMPPVRNLAAYTVLGRPPPETRVPQFEVPGDVRFAAATASIVASVKLDALLIEFTPDNLVETAFALEKGGFSADDIASTGNTHLFVRLAPSREQVRRVVRIAQLDRGHGAQYLSAGFVRDCDGVIASLGGIALAEAQRRVRVMAEAAHAGLRDVLGVVDSGGSATDAICGFGRGEPMRDLIQAAERFGPLSAPLRYASFVRTVSAAWRLAGSPNTPATPWRDSPDFVGRYWLGAPPGAFIADGRRAHGEVLLPGLVQANRVASVISPHIADVLTHSPYASAVEDTGVDGPTRSSLTLTARNADQLAQHIAAVKAYVARSDPADAPQQWMFQFSQGDCEPAIDRAIYRATIAAIARTGGKPLRYLVERQAAILGLSCSIDPLLGGIPASADAPLGAATASVVAGY